MTQKTVESPVIKTELSQIKVNTIRDGTPFKEVIEIKRVYQHPNYQYPKLYDDIAVVELGRRIAYDYDKVGNV